MKKRCLRILSAVLAVVMLATLWAPGTFAVPIDAPEAVDLSKVPAVWFEEHPEWQEAYERSWEIHAEMIRQIGTGTNPEGTYYVDEAFSSNLFMWDTSFMMLFDKYGYFEFPTLESMNNFYYNQHDEAGEEYGFICRSISETNGTDVWPNAFADGQNKALAAINPPLLSWAEWEQYQIHGDLSRFETVIDGKTVFERLCNFFDYIENSRKKENGLYGGMNGYGTGMDNTPNQDNEKLSWGENDGAQTYNDLSIQQALNAYYLVQIAGEIGETEKQAYYQAKYDELVERINELLWDAETGIYSNLAADGTTKTNISTPSSLWALTAGVATEEAAAAMIEKNALNSEMLYRPNGLATVQYDWDGATTAYVPEGGYWRGGIWAPTSYAYLKGLENYGYYDLAFQEAVRHLNAVTAAMELENTLYENYSPEYDIEDTVTGSRRKDFVGWTGCLSIGVIIENIIGMHPDAAKNTIDWYPALTEGYGISNLQFGKNSVELNVDARNNAESAVSFAVNARKAFTLNVHLNGETYELAIPAGESTHTVGAASEAEGGFLGVRVEKAEGTVLPANALDAVTFTNTLNEDINDGIGYQTTGNGLLYNINSVGYYWGGSESYADNPISITENELTGYAAVKKNHRDGDEGFMAMAPADAEGKTLRLVVGVEGGEAVLKAALSDASDAAVELRLAEGEYVIDLPYRADGADRSLLAQWVIDNDTAKSDATVSLMAVALLDEYEETVGIPSEISAEAVNGKLQVAVTPAFGETYDAYAIYYGTDRNALTRVEVEEVPASIEVAQYQSYSVAAAGIRGGVEGEKAEAAEPVFVEANVMNDYARALEDIEQTLPLILGENTEAKTVSWYQPAAVGVAYGSAMTFKAESNVAGYGVQNDGSVKFPPKGSAPVQCKITLTATLNGVTAERVLYTTVEPADLANNKAVFVSTENLSGLTNVDLTKVGSIDWVQLTDGTGFSLSNMAQKKDASVITDIYWADGGRQQTVTDCNHTYTATDGTAATVNRYALSTRNAGSSINVKLNGGEDSRRIGIYAGGWKANYRIDLLVNGRIYATADGSTGAANLSSTFIFDYQGSASDELIIRLTLVDPTAWGVTNGSAYLSAVTVGKAEEKSASFGGSENATSSSMMAVNLTEVGGLDWVQFTDGTSFSLANMAQKKDASVITDIYWADGGRQQTVTDNFYTYTSTDGTAATKDRYALSTRNVNSSINVKLSGGTEARKIRLYAGGWKSNYRVDLLVNGVVEATADGSTGSAQVSTLFTFDYQGKATDEVIVRLVLTDPTAWGVTNGSAYISAIAVDLVGHEYGPWETVTAAGVGTEGLRRRACIEAGCTEAEEQVLPALLGTRASELAALIARIESMDTQWYDAAETAVLQNKAAATKSAMGEMNDAALYAAEKELLIAVAAMEITTYPPVSAKGTLPMEPAFYVLSTVEDYLAWANAVNNGSWGRSGVILGDSIDLSAVTVSVTGFEGTFDGNGKTLFNLKVAMFSSFAGAIRDLTCEGFTRTGSARKQAVLVDATCGDAAFENITMKNCSLTNGYGISALMVGQPGGTLSFTDIRMEGCSASFRSDFGGKGMLVGGGADNSVWHGIIMDRITLEGCSLVSAAQSRSNQRTGMLAGEATSDGNTLIRNVLINDCEMSAPIDSDNSIYYDASVIACRLGNGDKINGCLIINSDFDTIKTVSSTNNHGMVSRCYWDRDSVTDLNTASAEALANGSLAYLLSQVSGQWTVRNGETVLKTADEQRTHQVEFVAGDEALVAYTDCAGKLLTIPEHADYIWADAEQLTERVFTADAVVLGMPRGDVNGDGVLNSADIVALLQFINGDDAINEKFADLNGDGSVTLADALRMLKTISA